MASTAKMKARKPSKVVKPNAKSKHRTASTKNYRFQSFSDRIAKLKIDPIRRRRDVEDREELTGETATYLGRSLEEWKDLNMSRTFTAFAKEAEPLCDSLPAVLHNEEKIMDLLVAYIEKGDSLSLEPLQSLFSHFARDLDVRFEKHFPRAVSAITAVAANHQDPAVIEWSFTRLAWLFKYLSRVLTPDLRPLYNLMSPYLGKQSQKPFIIRFAAESLSFLVRKAATTYERDPRPLDLIVSHIFQECQSVTDRDSVDLHKQGVMTLLTVTIKGVQGGIHSSALAILRSMLKLFEVLPSNESRIGLDIMMGTVTSLIHHTNAENFRPILETTIEVLVDMVNSARLDLIGPACELVFTLTTVRKGTRISDWHRVVAFLGTMVHLGEDSLELDVKARYSVLTAVAITFQSATIDALLPALNTLRALRNGQWAPYFLQYCDYFARLGQERFQTFLLPEFQRFILEQSQDNEERIFRLMPHLPLHGKPLTCTEPLQDLLVERVRSIANMPSEGSDPVPLVAANVALSAEPHFKLGASAKKRLQHILLNHVKTILERPDSFSQSFRSFSLGPCLARVLDITEDSESLRDLWPMLCDASPQSLDAPRFWSNLLRYIDVCQPLPADLEGSSVEDLESSLLRCLSSPSHDIRTATLGIMQSIYKLRDHSVPNSLLTAIDIESTPISLESSRTISMNIRKLAAASLDPDLDSYVKKVLATYCFGILHFQLAQAWEDAVNALAQMSTQPIGEEIIISLVQSWLEVRPADTQQRKSGQDDFVLDIDSSGFQVLSDFECANLAKVSAIARQTLEETNSGYQSSQDQFLLDISGVPLISPNAREQALTVLNKIPKVAEKRSRMLVPVLLQWVSHEDVEADEQYPENRWSRKDRKALLAIFAQFTNPKVLFKSDEVYSGLLSLCANGDVEIQRHALKAIYTWKHPAINAYEEHFTNMLDEARFRDVLSVFAQHTEGDEAVIRAEHRNLAMPVLLRLLYGRAVAGEKHVQTSRRKAIFIAVSQYGESVLSMFVEIVLGSANSARSNNEDNVDENVAQNFNVGFRQQYGMVKMVNDLLETLGSALEPFAIKLLDAVLVCTVAANRRLDSNTDGLPRDSSLLRSIRQAGVQCLVKIFSNMNSSAFPTHLKLISDELVAPRMEKFVSENAQSISGLLRLISAWSTSPKLASYLANGHDSLLVLDRVAELLREPFTKDEVRLFILQQILDNLTQDDADPVLTSSRVTSFVRSIEDVFDHQPSRNVLEACVNSFMRLATRIEDDKEANAVIKVCTGLLTKPNKTVSPATKIALLRTMSPLLDQFDIPLDTTLYDALGGLFSRLQDFESRTILSNVFDKVCKLDPQLSVTSQICEDLNALSGKLIEPDHERREGGFARIYREGDNFSAQQWLPILHNCLFYMRDQDDLVNRSSSSQAIQSFIITASSKTEELNSLVSNALLPGIAYGIKNSSELVRAEHLRLLGHTTEHLSTLPGLNDMKCLTVSGDDEASIFSNVLHIQQHRRLRALRRLSEVVDHLGSDNVTRFLLPLLEHFVFDKAAGDAGRALADQTVLTIGALARAMSWSAFKITFRRYSSYLKSKPEQETIIMRLLSALVDALGVRSERSHEASSTSHAAAKSEAIVHYFLPPLVDYIHLKDESTVDRRMPVAPTIIKLLLLLPEADMASRLAPVLTDICQILRSRSPEAREQTRKALAAILSLVGPSYLGFILKELRGALQRGSQLHVLSFTVHSLLVNAVGSYQPGDLDHCLPQLASIIMDDIFGVTGQEKDAEEYKSSMKEVKANKSFDTMELLARVTPIQKLGELIRPIRALLRESIDSTMLRKINDLLMRLRKGVDQNIAADSRDLLVFCHEVIRTVYAEQSSSAAVDGRAAHRKVNRYLVQLESSNKLKTKGTTTAQSFRLVSFALDLLRKVLRRHEDLLTPSNLAGFLPVAGDALVQGQQDVQLSAIKLLSIVMRVPLAELDNNASVYVKEAVLLIKSSPNMTSETAKAALELVTSVLREKQSVNVREKDVGEVLKLLKADIDEPDRQGIIYKFLRAVLTRKIVIPEMYEVMDNIRVALVTNPDRTVRESARSAYLQFILEYPQGKDRWNKQATFYVENLKYEHVAGRQSVMELLHQLLPKLQDETVQQLAFTLFVALVPVQTSDPEQSCRQMADILIAKLFGRSNDEQIDIFLTLMEKWLRSSNNTTIQVAALQCWSIILRARTLSSRPLYRLRSAIAGLLDANDSIESESHSRVSADALQTFGVLVETTPTIALDKESAGIWRTLQTYIGFPQEDASAVASKLLEAYSSHLAKSSSQTGAGLSSVPLRGSYGLEMDASDMHRLCRANLRILYQKSAQLIDTLINQTVRNLVFLGRCFAASGMDWVRSKHDLLDDARDENEDSTSERSSAIEYLFNRLSYIARQESLSTISRIAALQCQTTLVNHVSEVPHLVSVVQPLYILTDNNVAQPNDEVYKDLVGKARELLEVIQHKVGTQAYLSALGAARSAVKSRRDERRQKRKIEAVSAPERWAKEKRKKYEVKKGKGKERAMAAMGRRRGW